MDPSLEVLPVEPHSFDVVISCLGLHWINDLPELRIACSVAHMERAGGVTPVVSPFAQVRDGGNLLTRAGLALPAVDQDDFVVRYAAGPAEVVDHMR
ncbi:methyltransf_11 domain-containing protein, partial [Haematococcus lacustris]